MSDMTSSTEGALAPYIGQGHQPVDEDQRFDERQKPKAVESHSPGIEKNGLHIENDEDQANM